MAETKQKKSFNAGAYAVAAAVVIAVVLVALTIFAFTTRYTAFSPEKVAQSYVDTIVQTGDGYNAYKNTLVSKNQKYGDFIINAYMRPYVNEDAEQAEFVGTGSKEEQDAIDAVYNTMYEYYNELLKTYGMDNYDAVFDNYFSKLVEVRHEVYGDEFMDTSYMFGAFEANVASYGESLTGSDEVLAADEKTVLKKAQTGLYQEIFGKDYKFTTTVKECKELSYTEIAEYCTYYGERIKPVAESGEAKADKFGITDSDKKHQYKTAMINAFKKLDCQAVIDSVAKATVEVKEQNGNTVAIQELYVVKIGNSWYVDNTNINTTGLYLAQ